MPIPESTLSKWIHHQAGTAFKQAHVPIREALDAYNWAVARSSTKYSSRAPTRTTPISAGTATSMWSSVWRHKLKPRVVVLSGEQLQE